MFRLPNRRLSYAKIVQGERKRVGEKTQKRETRVGKLECTKRGIERDKKTLRKFRLPFPSASKGDFSSEKPSVSPNMARRKCAHKAASCRNKDRNLCPYGRKALKANEKGPVKGLLLYGYSKDKAKTCQQKRQKARRDVGGTQTVASCR